MSGLVRLTNVLVGGLNGYNNKEGGLPYHISGGSIALSGLLASAGLLDKSVTNVRGLAGVLVAGPLIMGMMFGMGHLTGEGVRYTKDTFSTSNQKQE